MDERQQELRQMVLEDMRQPFRWWWLSFVSDEELLGAAVIEAGGLFEAVFTSRKLGSHPGGHVIGFELEPWEVPPDGFLERVLVKPEIEDNDLLEWL